MKSAIKIRKSVSEDIPSIIRVFESARKFMRLKDNPNQWNDGYPGEKDVLKDIANGNSYVGINPEGEIVMTFAFIKGEDPTYKNIFDGQWLNNEDYGTIHRIASNGKNSGVLKAACDFCFQNVENIRIDTHEDNSPMLKALENLNFSQCGIIYCRDGSPRIAFQKIKD